MCCIGRETSHLTARGGIFHSKKPGWSAVPGCFDQGRRHDWKEPAHFWWQKTQWEGANEWVVGCQVFSHILQMVYITCLAILLYFFLSSCIIPIYESFRKLPSPLLPVSILRPLSLLGCLASLPGISQEAQAGVEQLLIHSLLLYFFDYFLLAIIKSCVSLSGAEWVQAGASSFWCRAKTLGIPVSSSVLKICSRGRDLLWFLWWKQLKSLLGPGVVLGAGGKGAAEHLCVKSSASSCPWHLLSWGQQLPINGCGFCFP